MPLSFIILFFILDKFLSVWDNRVKPTQNALTILILINEKLSKKKKK